MTGLMPRLLRPSLMISFARLPALQRFYSLPGRFGYLRHTFGWAIANSSTREDLLARCN